MDQGQIVSKVICFGVELELLLKPKPDLQITKDISKLPFDAAWLKLGQWILDQHGPWRKENIEKHVKSPPKTKDGIHPRPRAIFAAQRFYPLSTNVEDLKGWVADESQDKRIPGVKLNFQSWLMVRDGSLSKSQMGCYGYEFVSPVFRYGIGDIYGLVAVHDLFQFFTDIGLQIQPDDSCSTHVHLSPELGIKVEKPTAVGGTPNFVPYSTWTLDRLKKLACASFYFELPLRSLFPDHRLNPNNYYTKEWHSNAWLGKDYPDLFKAAPAPANLQKKVLKELSEALNLEKLVERVQPDGDRSWTWNYHNLTSAKSYDLPSQSIEFRWPPGSANASEACKYVELAANFAFAAVAVKDLLSLQLLPQTLTGLAQFIGPYGRKAGPWSAENIDATIGQGTQLKQFKFSDVPIKAPAGALTGARIDEEQARFRERGLVDELFAGFGDGDHTPSDEERRERDVGIVEYEEDFM